MSVKTRSLERIEQKMETVEKDSFRFKVLESVKKFKTSWIDLGQALFAVYKDKLYKGWGFLTFEAYISKEVNIHKQTAIKLLRSYYFLEKEEPAYLDRTFIESGQAASLPNYEAINLLRLAKNKKDIGRTDYESLKKGVFEKGMGAKEIKKELTTLIRQRQDLTPEEARKKRTEATLKRFVSTLKSLKRELEVSKLVSVGIIKEAEALLKKLEAAL